ncbi:MAG: hypothetical protein ICCCNLDF_03127 [Planctomycetes bacterium]|nr:hypothetical protein [Planctomycetota bacterium]HRJ77673.1 hypothetical protein [Planctomycetota bacterium]
MKNNSLFVIVSLVAILAVAALGAVLLTSGQGAKPIRPGERPATLQSVESSVER